jgi:ATPase subunit of ABC transporter with duplicated ATPase domains
METQVRETQGCGLTPHPSPVTFEGLELIGGFAPSDAGRSAAFRGAIQTMTKRSRVSVLVGPKGAGKSTLCTLLAREVGAEFERVEPIYLNVLRAHPDRDPTSPGRSFVAFEYPRPLVAQADSRARLRDLIERASSSVRETTTRPDRSVMRSTQQPS